jgi:hypothetical protein
LRSTVTRKKKKGNWHLHPSGLEDGAVGGARRHAGLVGEVVAEDGAGGRERSGERGHLAEPLRGVLSGVEGQQLPLLLGHQTTLDSAKTNHSREMR